MIVDVLTTRAVIPFGFGILSQKSHAEKENKQPEVNGLSYPGLSQVCFPDQFYFRSTESETDDINHACTLDNQ